MNKRFCNKIVAFLLSFNMIFWNVPLSALATEISGVSGNNGVYNIEASKVSGSTGFRHYDKFNLSNGDIANLIYKNNYSKFVNLVNNQININGLVQTLKNGNFYNGHAIFVSPNGMIVGAGGVLNVGSLSVLTPTKSKFNNFLEAYNSDNLASFVYGGENYKALITDSNGNVVINGRILARDEVNIFGNNIKIGNGTDKAGIIAGVKNQDTNFRSVDLAKQTFDSLVSNNIKDTNSFALKDGKIKIIANNSSKFSEDAGDVKTSVDIKKADIGANDIEISSKAEIDRQERIDLAQAKVDIEDSSITGDTVLITAEATQNKKLNISSLEDDLVSFLNVFSDTFGPDTPSVGKLWGTAGKAESEVNIKNSTIQAINKYQDGENKDTSIAINAIASSETEENANFLTPTIFDILSKPEAKISEYFSKDIYNGFEGARSSAKVTVDNSTIKAVGDKSGDILISTDSSSSLDANNRILAFLLPVGMYGVGTETLSKAIIQNNSKITAENGDVNLNSLSTNNNSINITNNSLVSIILEDSYIAMLLNNTVKTETEASILNSTVEASDLTVLATNLSESESEISMESKAGRKTQGTQDSGNSSVSITGILNRSDKKVTALIKDSEVETEEKAEVIAQNLNITSNNSDASVFDFMVEQPKTFDQGIKDKLKKFQFKYLNKNIFDTIKGKQKVKAEDPAILEAGGALVWNDTNNTTTAKIENSTVKAKDVNVKADTVDLLANSATVDSQGEEKVGLGVSVVYNEQHNTTTANVKGSEITSDNLSVNALTELPMNQGKLTFGFTLPFAIKGADKIQIGTSFAAEANGKMDFDFVYPKSSGGNESNFEVTGLAEQNITDTYADIKPKLRLSGFFNNMAQSNSCASLVGISGSVIYNEVVNNTISDITGGSNITLADEGKLIVNAVNSVMGLNGAGMFDVLIKQINYKIPGQQDWEYEPTIAAGTFGLGVNFVWDDYTNNATAKIDSSTINAPKADVDVASATEQAYFTVTMTGAKSEKIGIDGSIHNQNIKGTTLSVISNEEESSDTITAKSVNVSAGNAKVKTTGGKIERDSETNLVKLKDEREAEDSITNIVAQGAWTSQYEEVDNTVQTNSFGVAIGASVGVTNIDRTVKAEINKAIVNADNIKVNSNSYNQNLNVEIAAAFSGGVTQKENDVVDAQDAAENAQDHEDDENIFGNLFDGEEEYMRNPVGNALNNLQSQFSLSGAGSVIVTNDKTDVQAQVNNSTVNVKDSLEVNANRESRMLNITGAMAKSKKVGAGAGVNIYKQDGTSKAFIEGSEVKFTGTSPKLDVTANNKNQILDIAIGAGVASNSASEGKGFQAAVGGSASINTLKPIIEAYINSSNISSEVGKIATKIEGKNDLTIYNISGGGSYLSGAASGISAGGAFNYNNIKNTINSYVKNSTLDNIKTLDISSSANNNMKEFAIAGAIVTDTTGLNIQFAGSGDADYIHDTITSKIVNSTITADEDVNVIAESESKNLQVAGSLDYSSANSGVGVNGDVAVNVYRNDILAEIDETSKIQKARNVNVAARSTETANVIPVGLSISTGENYAMMAANVGVNVIENSVKAYVKGDIGDDTNKVDNVNVTAYDETTLYTRGGTLVLASADTTANIGGSFNRDKISKTVEAKITNSTIKSKGDVTVSAGSINSLGGTKNSAGKYDRDDITSEDYNDKLMKKDSDKNYSDINLSNDFSNWNMFYNLSVGGAAAISGAVVTKTIDNNVKAEISKSDITAKDLIITAEDYSVKNIISGQISASSKGAIGAQVLVTQDNSNTSALILDGSDIKISDDLELNAKNIKDNNEIVVAANAAGRVAGGVNILINKIKDNNTAKIDSSTVKAQNLEINSNEDINASKIVVAASGSGQGVAINVSPLVNKYEGTTISQISSSKVNDAEIKLQSDTNIKTRDIGIGVAGAGQGFAANGLAIKNTYDTKTKSVIDNNSKINTSEDVVLNSNSTVNSNNWIVGVSGVGQGVSIVANVIINNLISEVESSISDSNIINAGKIILNSNKDKKDRLNNYAISGSVAGEGVAASSNVIYNIYENDITSKIYNTSVNKSGLIDVQSFSDRAIQNTNIGLSITGIGADLLADAIVNQIGTDTIAFIDAKSETINTTGKLTVKAEDNTFSDNTMGFGVGAGLGAALGANINLYYSDNLARAEVLSDSSGQINSKTAEITSKTTGGLDNTNVGVSAGLVGIAGDVVAIKLGKRLGYTDSETKSGIKDAETRISSIYKDSTEEGERNFRTDSSSRVETGAVSRVKGNLKSIDNIDIKAESKLKGKGSGDKLTLSNVTVTAGLGAGSVGVKDVQLSNNTIAEVAGGKVESENGNVSLDAKNSSNVEISSVEVRVSGLTFSGGSSVYNNNSETIAQIGSSNNSTTVKAKNVDIVSSSTNNSVIDATSVVVTGGEIVAVDLSENKDNNHSSAIVTGKTDIISKGKLNVHSTANTDLKSTKATVSVAGVSMVSVSKNEAEATSITKAIIENVEGRIEAENIDVIADYDTMSVFSKANVTAIKLGNLYSGDSSGSKMNAQFISGIDSADGLVIDNSGKTYIASAKAIGTNKISAKSEINNVNVSLVGFVAETSTKAENDAQSYTYLKAKDHCADSLEIDSRLNTIAEAVASATKVTITIGVNLVSADAKNTSKLNVVTGGKNTIANSAIINANNNADVNSDLYSFNFAGLVGGGQRIRMASELTSSTTGNIGGDFSFSTANINFNTVRNSILNKSAESGGGLVNVNDFTGSNKLTGTSNLTLYNLDTDNDLRNSLNIKNISTNTFDITTTDSSGGFIDVSDNLMTNELNTSTTTNFMNSNVISLGTVSYETKNNTIVKDTGSMSGGGFIAVLSNNLKNQYTSGAKLYLKDSSIIADDIDFLVQSDISQVANNSGYLDYTAKGGGFIAGQKLTVENTLNQTSEIALENSKISAQNDVELNVKDTSKFRQRIDNKASGFVSLPISEAHLTVTNNQKISLDAGSEINAMNDAEFNLDTTNTLESNVSSVAKNFGGAPEAYSYLTLNANNTIDNYGQIKAGNLADINFMEGSVNNLTLLASTKNEAAVAKTYEDGMLKKAINNALNVKQNATIQSNKDIEVRFTSGTGKTDSKVKWDTTSYIVFGIPIHDSDVSYPSSTPVTNALNLDGKMIAGQNNSKYMLINRDGTVDYSRTTGFSSDDYTLRGNGLDGQAIKNEKLANIRIKINNLEESLKIYEDEKTELENIKTDIEKQKEYANQVINEINELNDQNYYFLDNKINEFGLSEFISQIQFDIHDLVVGEGDDKLSESIYGDMRAAYSDSFRHSSEQTPTSADGNKIPTLLEFFENYENVTEAQKNTIIAACNEIKSRLSTTPSGEIITYSAINPNQGTTKPKPNDYDIWIQTNKMAVVTLNGPTWDSEGNVQCVEKTNFTNYLATLDELIKPYNSEAAVVEDKINTLNTKITALNNQYTAINNKATSEFGGADDEYSIEFKDFTSTPSHILVKGITNNQIYGSGTFDVAPQLFKIDNYSTRSLIFNNIDVGVSSEVGLYIDNKNYEKFADNADNKAVNGEKAYQYMYNNGSWNDISTTGVHYITKAKDGSGIEINNFYDNANPLAKNLDIPYNTKASDIRFEGILGTSGALKVFNDSGSIIADNFMGNYINGTYGIKDAINLTATKGDINLTAPGWSTASYVWLKDNSNIFAGNSIKMEAPEIVIEGKVTAGYNKDLNLTITDDMLSNLKYDPTTGENTLIDLGETPWLNENNNIKALYKDGEILVFNINNPLKANTPNLERGKISYIIRQDSDLNIDETNLYDGYQNIKIDNQTDKQMNVYNISNIKSEGGMYMDGAKIKDAENVNKATTHIISNGKLILDGVINNNLKGNYYPDTDTSGILYVTAKNGIDVSRQENLDGETINSIKAAGSTNININNGESNIEGDIDNYGSVAVINTGSGNLKIGGNITNTAQNDYQNIQIISNGNTNISSTIESTAKGSIVVKSLGLETADTSKIIDKQGNISIVNSYGYPDSKVMNLAGLINAENGNIYIENNGINAIVGGKIVDELGDVVINNQKGDMTISSDISHNKLTQGTGQIFINNAQTAGNLSIASNLRTYGSGKADEDDSDIIKAIKIINNSPNSDLSLSKLIEARVGNIEIINNGNGLDSIADIKIDTKGDINIVNNKNNAVINGTIATDEGDINILSGLNANDLSVGTTTISQNKGNTNITQNGNGNLIYTGNIENKDGNTTIVANSNAKDVQIGGRIVNDKGDVLIKNDGKNHLTVSSLITDKKGDITILNNGKDVNISATIKDEKGNILISNTGSSANIGGDITANAGKIDILNKNPGELNILAHIKNEYGNIDIANDSTDGMNFKEGATVENIQSNTTILNNAGDLVVDEGVTIQNNQTGYILAENKGGKFQIGGILQHLGTGNITVKNSGVDSDQGGFITQNTSKISVNKGSLNIDNSKGYMELSGEAENKDGNITINHSSDDNSFIYGTILAQNGDIDITAGGSKMFTDNNTDITNQNGNIVITKTGSSAIQMNGGKINGENGDITINNLGTDANESYIATAINHNILNNDASGMVKIFNNEKSGQLIIKSDITTKGKGKTVDIEGNDTLAAVIIDNESDSKGLIANGEISARLGDIIIINKNGDIESNSEIKNTEKGDIKITNYGKDIKVGENGKISNAKGNVKINNQGTGELALEGAVENHDGYIDINNSGTNTKIADKIDNENGIITVSNSNGNLDITDTADIVNSSGDIKITNDGSATNIAGSITDKKGDVTVRNNGDGDLTVAQTGNVTVLDGIIDILNKNKGAFNIGGNIENKNGIVYLTNLTDDGLKLSTTGSVLNDGGDMIIGNYGTGNMTVEGSVIGNNNTVKLVNYDSDILIGEYDSNNDNYIQSKNGNVEIEVQNGNVINNINDSGNNHRNYDKGNPDKAYKTLISADNNLFINVQNGDIGSSSAATNPGFSIDATTRDYTDSINVNVKGTIFASAINDEDNKDNKRLVNLRGKESDLNIGFVLSDGDVLLTASDWKQADENPAPSEEEYYRGYSIKNAIQGSEYSVYGENISIIASDEVGSNTNPLAIMQNTETNPNSSISVEAENDINILAKANSDNELKLYQLISKRGDIGLSLESDAVIREITANKGLKIVQKAQNLTIIDIGLKVPEKTAIGDISPVEFNDILFPHDKIGQGVTTSTQQDVSSKSIIPNYINISVLDAMENPDRGDSNLTIYSAYVKGNHGENTQYYENGTRLADVTLMADNIYANSSKAKDSDISTKHNPNGYTQPAKTYSEADFGGDSTEVYEAKGINSYGKGEVLSFDVLGVDVDLVKDYVNEPKRDKYSPQHSITPPKKFENPNDEITYYGTDYLAKNVTISANDYADTNRGIVFDTLYANDAYINTSNTDLSVTNGYITNFAELRNKDKIAVVDNDFRRLIKPADIQLYTEKTGSFSLGLNRTINMKTTAPTVYNNPHMLVNGYHSEWNFVNLGQKEAKDRFDRLDLKDWFKRKYNEPQKRLSLRFDTTKDKGLVSNYNIYDISTTGALIENIDNLKEGNKIVINIQFDDVDIDVNAKVVNIHDNLAGIEFINMPQDVANQILYRYMQQKDSMKIGTNIY